jgi:ABC-type lipoprotein export system ATPase subunit
MQVKFEKIVRQNIFKTDFKALTDNNIIDFEHKNMAIIYGPNGTGKTSLAMVLGKENDTEFTLDIEGVKYTENDDTIFHIINDQNGRNIIQGSTEDFILGDNIRREYELKGIIESKFKDLFETNLAVKLKQEFGISTKTSPFDDIIDNQLLKEYISDIANNRSKGKKIDRNSYIDNIGKLVNIQIDDYDSNKLVFIISDYKNQESIIRKLKGIDISSIKKEPNLRKINENNDAIGILEKYHYLDDCIICESKIDRVELIEKKRQQIRKIFSSLNETSKKIVDELVKMVPQDDPFNIEDILLDSVLTGSTDRINGLLLEIESFYLIFNSKLNNLFKQSLIDCEVIESFKEYSAISLEKPEFESEDIIFIEQFVNDCIGRKIELKRDENKNLHLLLNDKEFLNQNRNTLFLSNGEQNFLSLAFELLKAKKTKYDFIVLDDPISSFDSIYKNKIAYSIVKILNNKKVFVLTHNTDLIKLIEHQVNDCYEMYYLNNTEGESNGFIHINKEERKILIYIHEFINLLRANIKDEIIDEKLFLISLTPFMRGYCQIINNKTKKEELTKIMHGYNTESFDLTKIYNELFSCSFITNPYFVSAVDIMSLSINGSKAIRDDKYPLLSKTLNHTLTYLYLRLLVEKKLVDKYSVNTGKYDLLSGIINQSFKGTDLGSIKNRVFFLSKKTLLNEFNHFEIDMNIFQPAIDITNTALKKERDDIINKLAEL